MTIKIFAFDYLTHETIIDSTVEVNGDMEIAEANYKAFREMLPNCQVNFVIDSDNFMMSPPLNQQKDEKAYDEGRMSWEDYMDKWYSGALESDDDMRELRDISIDQDIATLERYDAEDWASRDSVCH